MHLIRILALIFAIHQPLHAQTLITESNEKHCGSGFTENFIPENLLGCKFGDACKAHDVCYGRCDIGGDLYGSDYCTKSEFSIQRLNSKAKCDISFYAAIDENNNNKMICRRIGAIYTSAVVIAGQGPFNGIPPPPDVISKIALSSRSPEEAGEKLRSLASLSQRGEIDFSMLELQEDKLIIQLNDPLFKNRFNKNGMLVIPNGTAIPQIKSLTDLSK